MVNIIGEKGYEGKAIYKGLENVLEIIKTLENHTFKVYNMNESSISQDSIIIVVYKS